MVVGEATDGGESVMQAAPFAFGCLNAAVLDDELTRAGLLEVVTRNVDQTLARNPKFIPLMLVEIQPPALRCMHSISTSSAACRACSKRV